MADRARARDDAPPLQETDRLIGGVGLDGSTGDESEEPALGYWLNQPYWSNGYAREAVAAVIDYALRTLGMAMMADRLPPMAKI